MGELIPGILDEAQESRIQNRETEFWSLGMGDLIPSI
jgi:hypothetical protein